MPKSRTRKGRKPYKGKFNGTYGADPLGLFTSIARGELGEQEENAACELLLATMQQSDEQVVSSLVRLSGLDGPPTTTADIRTIAHALVLPPEENDGAEP